VAAELVWTDPAWLTETTAWIDAKLDGLGRPRTGPVEQPHVRTWATALRVPTAEGPVWLKAPVPLLAFEGDVVGVLRRTHPNLVSPLLAANTDTGWILLEDAGERLRELVDGDAVATGRAWELILPLYADLQRAAAPAVDALLAAGLPDFRLSEISRVYGELLADETLLRATDEALSDNELQRLHDAAPRVAEMCAELASFGYEETVQHDDLHDGQVFVRDDRYRILDWGDACVSHPFSTLTVTMNSIAHRLGEDFRRGRTAVRARDAYLDAWPGTRMDKLRAFELADKLGALSRARNYRDLVRGLPAEHTADVADGHPGWLRGFLEATSGP
jgi:Phosphotransferase enzyme family